jgi:hypothetical protein
MDREMSFSTVSPFSEPKPRNRRHVLGLLAGAGALTLTAQLAPWSLNEAEAQTAAQRIADHFSRVKK